MPRRLLRSVARTAGRTAVIAGTATAVSGHVAHRQHQKQHAAPPRSAQHAAEGNGNDVVSRLKVLADLRASGALSDKEFANAKAKVLHG